MKLSLPIPPCNVVPLFALSLGENKHHSFDRGRGYKDGGGGEEFFSSKVTSFEDIVSAILSLIHTKTSTGFSACR